MKERFSIKCVVFLMLTRINSTGQTEVLLQRRQNTGYMDGMYDFASSGHLEKGETLEQATVRETKEEIGIDIPADNLKNMFFGYEPREGYLRVVFTPTIKIAQTPNIMEPEKCTDLQWFNIKDLPNNISPFVRTAIENIFRNIHYSTL